MPFIDKNQLDVIAITVCTSKKIMYMYSRKL